MGFTVLAITYLIGGVTFLPLLLAAAIGAAWYTSPKIDQPRSGGSEESKGTAREGRSDHTHDKARDERYALEGAASGTFAVLRSYNLQAAVQALSARSGTNNGSNSNAAIDANAEIGGKGSNNSESVYQSMYRSVFDRNKNMNGTHAVLDHGTDDPKSGAPARKRPVEVGVFHIVLRHGHLMLYDSPAQLEVRQVISLAHHSVSLKEGSGPDSNMAHAKEADLFIKRTAIVLTPVSTADNHEQPAPPSKPFYLYCSNCSEKEDFYHALLCTREPPPIPHAIDTQNIIKLQSNLHSNSLTPDTRAFNALIGRVFLALHRTSFVENLVRSKIEKKISRVQKPAFIASIAVKSIDLGDSAPIISSPRLRDINISGDMTLALEMRYTGGLRLVVSALAKLDLGTRFKTRTVDLVLAASLQRLHTHVLVRVKPPPSNRLWLCFESMPDMDIKVEPVVSQRQITYAFILRAIEERIRAVVGETLVNPNWDDIPFFDTSSQEVRGGIWINDGTADTEMSEDNDKTHGKAAPRSAAKMSKMDEQAKSMPSLRDPDTEGLSGASTGSDIAPIRSTATMPTGQADTLKRRSVASLASPPHSSRHDLATSAGGATPPLPVRPLRSPSFPSPSPSTPSVAISGANAGPVKSDDASLRPKGWRSRASLPSQGGKDAVKAVREMHDRSVRHSHDIASVVTEPDSPNFLETKLEEHKSAGERSTYVEPSSPETPSSYDKFVPARADSERSTTSSIASSTSSRQQQQRKNILAATAAATTAARNWSWNAIAVRTSKGRGEELGSQNHQPRDAAATLLQREAGQSQQPIGRGRPLPPPGTPLPGPPKTLWQAAAGGLGGVGKSISTVRRKPVLPPRRTDTSQTASTSTTVPATSNGSQESLDRSDTQDIDHQAEADHVARGSSDLKSDVEEFGPWRENNGHALVAEPAITTESEAMPYGDTMAEGEQVEEADNLGVSATGAGNGTLSPALSVEDISSDSTAPMNNQKRIPPPLPARRRMKSHEPSPITSPADSAEETRELSEDADTVIALPDYEQEATHLVDDHEDHESPEAARDQADQLSVNGQKLLSGGDLTESDFEQPEELDKGEAIGTAESSYVMPTVESDDDDDSKDGSMHHSGEVGRDRGSEVHQVSENASG